MVALSDVEIWLVSERLQMVFLNLPETREERVRRDEREKIRREVEQRRMEERAMLSAWYRRLKEAHAKGERFDEPPPWEE